MDPSWILYGNGLISVITSSKVFHFNRIVIKILYFNLKEGCFIVLVSLLSANNEIF